MWTSGSLNIRYTTGKRGDIIVFDRYIKNILGEQKHIILKPSDKAKKFLEWLMAHPQEPQFIRRCLEKIGEGNKVVFYRVQPAGKCTAETVVYEHSPREPDLEDALFQLATSGKIFGYKIRLVLGSNYESSDHIKTKELIIDLPTSQLVRRDVQLDRETVEKWLPVMEEKWRELLAKYGDKYPRAILHELLREYLRKKGLKPTLANGYELPIIVKETYDMKKLDEILGDVAALAKKYGYKLKIAGFDPSQNTTSQYNVGLEYRYMAPDEPEIKNLEDEDKQKIIRWLYLTGFLANYEYPPIGIERGIMLGLVEKK